MTMLERKTRMKEDNASPAVLVSRDHRPEGRQEHPAASAPRKTSTRARGRLPACEPLKPPCPTWRSCARNAGAGRRGCSATGSCTSRTRVSTGRQYHTAEIVTRSRALAPCRAARRLYREIIAVGTGKNGSCRTTRMDKAHAPHCRGVLLGAVLARHGHPLRSRI